MKRVLLDTNVYGELAIDSAVEKIRSALATTQNFVFYGMDVIRKELRETPKNERFRGKNLRIILLSMYDGITKEHILKASLKISELADDFYKAYKEFGGLKLKHEIIADFLIVAAATFNGLDVVVSSDEKTMLTENALKAYRLITAVKKNSLPDLIVYEKFRRWFV